MTGHYEERGSGPAIVFMHGAVMDRTMFQAQLADLSDEFRAIAVNHRARTERWQGPYDLWDLADDLKDFMDGLGLERAVIAGMSMGGYAALRFALRYPERTRGIVMIASTAVPNTPEEQVEFAKDFEKVKDAPTVPRDWAEWVASVVFGETTTREQPELVESWIEHWMRYSGPSLVEEANCWLVREDLTDRLPEIDVPVLILHGAEDVAIPLDRAAPMEHQLPDARMVVVEGAGHTVNVEAAREVNDRIRSFLREIDGRAGNDAGL
jgi:pimeloyl-ACP methyl ester carboxylesterase